MEQNSEPGRINISETTQYRVNQKFELTDGEKSHPRKYGHVFLEISNLTDLSALQRCLARLVPVGLVSAYPYPSSRQNPRAPRHRFDRANDLSLIAMAPWLTLGILRSTD